MGRVLLIVYAGASVVAFVAYGLDKAAAMKGARRTPEATLHVLALLGGWPGALLAQRVFHHKTRKRSFQLVYWTCVGANICVLLAIAYVTGSLTP